MFVDAPLGPERPGEAARAPTDDEALDAYSRVVSTVAERLSSSVASLRVARRVRGGRRLDGGGSAVVISPDGFMLTSAHVVARTNGGRAAFGDGRVVELRTGDLFYIPPEPHDSWVVGDEPYVSLHFLGADHYAR